MMNRHVHHLRCRSLATPLCLMALAAALGCGSQGHSPFERFERLPTDEQLVTVPLGDYVVPIPVDVVSAETHVAATQVQIEFSLHAAVLPQYERTLASNCQRLEGRLRDNVIEVCRNLPVDDLQDPTLSALKTHLADSLKPFIGAARIERIHITDPQFKRL